MGQNNKDNISFKLTSTVFKTFKKNTLYREFIRQRSKESENTY